MNMAAVRPLAIGHRTIVTAVAGVGFAAVITQLVAMRELLGAFSGNELVLGISLGAWLLLTGTGAALGRLMSGRSPRVLAAGLVWVAIVPLLQVAVIRGWRDAVLLPGAVAGPLATVLGSLALLAPFCLVSGALLTMAGDLQGRLGAEAPVARVYVADTVGSVAGGACFTFLLVQRFDHFALLAWPAFLNLALAAVIAVHARARLVFVVTASSATALGILLATTNVDAVTTGWQHRGELVFRSHSPYGRLVVVADAGQLTFFENGVAIAYTENTAQVEETVHYALSQRPAARRVLLIGGAISGTAREALRHGVERVICIELDPRVVEAARRLVPENVCAPRLECAVGDGRRYLQGTTTRFDVVIVDLPDPSTWQMNRYFTQEFYLAVRRVLEPGGVLAFGLGRYENYVSPTLARLLSSGHATLRGIFAHIVLIPGGRVYFLASDAPLDADIAASLAQRGVSTRLLTPMYLETILAPDRKADIERAIAAPSDVNRDFRPTLYHRQVQHWLAQFPAASGLAVGVAGLAFVGYVLALPPLPRVIFASGFAASALEIVLLLGFQVFYGSLYQQVALVVTVFMAGLALGAMATTRWQVEHRRASRHAIILGFVVAGVAAAMPLVLPRLNGLDVALGSSLPGQLAICAVTFLLALAVGAQFPLVSAATSGNAAVVGARLFSADLVGAAVGALLVSTWLIPVAGVANVCFGTAALNIATAAVAFRQLHGQ